MLKLYSHDSLFSSLLEYRVLQNISAIVQFHKTCRGGTLKQSTTAPFQMCAVDTYVYISVLLEFNEGGCRYSRWKYFFSIITKDTESKVMFTFLKTVFCY